MMNALQVMLRLGFNAYAKTFFHDHPSQKDVVSTLQARTTNWKSKLHKEQTKHKTLGVNNFLHACSSASLELTKSCLLAFKLCCLLVIVSSKDAKE